MVGQPLERKTYSIPQAATILGIGQTRAYSLAKSGELPGVRNLGGKFLVSKKELDAFVDGDSSETSD